MGRRKKYWENKKILLEEKRIGQEAGSKRKVKKEKKLWRLAKTGQWI